jgi:hypothetical protein
MKGAASGSRASMTGEQDKNKTFLGVDSVLYGKEKKPQLD